MGKVRFRCREMVKIQFLDKNVVPGSTIYVDPGSHLTQQNQDVRSAAAGCNNRMPMCIGSFSYTRSGLVSLSEIPIRR